MKSYKTSEVYWTNFWRNYHLPAPLSLQPSSLSNYVSRIYHQKFKEAFSGYDLFNAKILELGCGNSVFLSYFSKEFGMDVYGIDYTELGCKQTKAILARDEVNGTIILGDIFNPPAELLETFDIVCSFGVAEHFDDTKETLSAFSRFLKPNGLLITSIPNMAGITGFLQKWMYKDVWDVHKIMSKEDFSAQFQDSGLHLIKCDYFIPISFGLTLEPIGNNSIKFKTAKKFLTKILQVFSKLVWKLDDYIKLPQSKLFSGGIFSVAKKVG